MLTIGQLADYAGVTIKAVRHYHQRGLLAEPGRDVSGYRRYTAKDAIDLVKIRTLAQAGVPLARIKDLLDADADTLAAAIAEIDHDLEDRIAQLRRTREQLAELRGGDRLFVSPEVADYLEELRRLGVSERRRDLERDGWILMQTASPEDAAGWIAEKRQLIGDPEFRALYLEHDAAYDWPPDDPRLPALAERTRSWFAGRVESPPVRGEAIARLARQSQPGASSPAWERLARLMEG
ncbi:Transcriptional regulator, MerR family [[Actinomadura] parvosata subsp. kistnae]|uniref:MerR family transcriptional regulator n=1 Tax=[Actinomadura] parvosata subsp. kistnae TaxID=1909395 RepID=A0A1V0AH64_9ACTN|nr:MerR family transcriptional regulator [Nonomuraea sp. ATCC 55076]AQZ69519.1 MerR family transcriptional regulator [Nonomuraea sp. ATCC 55076]SPL91812.1 Transcriptional regulator, MerR family [Actinomadura parvosata subsp. kistnae]